MIVYHGTTEVLESPDVKHSIGNVADDDIFKVVDMYFRGLWDKEKVLSEMKYYKMNDQICIVNQNVLDEVLEFKYSYEVKQDGR